MSGSSEESGPEGGTVVKRGYRVHGRVQGVGFRWWARSVASELGVDGTVRNLPDGSVELMARAGAEVIGRLEARLRKGAPMSRVDRLEVVSCVLPDAHSGFVIEQ